jgi:hypothetical protein
MLLDSNGFNAGCIDSGKNAKAAKKIDGFSHELSVEIRRIRPDPWFHSVSEALIPGNVPGWDIFDQRFDFLRVVLLPC